MLTTSTRRDEATAVARSLGAEVIWAGLPDARIGLHPALNRHRTGDCEGPSSRRFAPLAYVSIDSEMSQKLELISLHRSQLKRRPFDEWARVTALYRGLHARPPSRYAEAFRPVRQELLLSGFVNADAALAVRTSRLLSIRPTGNGSDSCQLRHQASLLTEP